MLRKTGLSCHQEVQQCYGKKKKYKLILLLKIVSNNSICKVCVTKRLHSNVRYYEVSNVHGCANGEISRFVVVKSMNMVIQSGNSVGVVWRWERNDLKWIAGKYVDCAVFSSSHTMWLACVGGSVEKRFTTSNQTNKSN